MTGWRHRKVLAVLAMAWAIAAWVIGFTALDHVNVDVRALVTVLTVVLPAAAFLGGYAILRRRDGLAIACLLISLAAPTYGAAALNLVAVVIVMALIGVRRQETVAAARSPL